MNCTDIVFPPDCGNTTCTLQESHISIELTNCEVQSIDNFLQQVVLLKIIYSLAINYSPDIKNVPRGLPNFQSLSHLELSDNGIERMEIVGANAEMKTLNKNYNYIENIPFDVIQNLTHLEELHLEGNGIKTIEPEVWQAFSHLKHLRWIDLNQNMITEIDVAALTVIKDDFGYLGFTNNAIISSWSFNSRILFIYL